MSNPSVTVSPGQVLAGKYRVDRLLGAGGMGFVVAATNVHLSKTVALKMMLPGALSVEGAVERFEREARAAVRLKSQHVAQVLDIGHDANMAPYIVMELLEGSDFEQLVLRRGPLPIQDVVEYVLQACEAIAEAHSIGIVHRDIKLKNLFLTRRIDGSSLVKVLDFGISKWTTAENHSLTKTSEVMGSPNYMSPEQVRSSRDVDHRTDIWSLGVVLFELLTGQVPFVADTLPALCAMVLEQPPPKLSTLRSDLPEGIGHIIERCLAKSPAARYQNVGELISALAPYGPRRSDLAVSPHASTLPLNSNAPAILSTPPRVSGPAPPLVPRFEDGAISGASTIPAMPATTSAPPAASGVAATTTMFGDMKSRPGLTVGVAIGVGLLACAMVGTLWLGVKFVGASGSVDAGPASSTPVVVSAPSASPSAPPSVAVSAPPPEPDPPVALTPDAGPARALVPPPSPARAPTPLPAPRASAAVKPSAGPAPSKPTENPFEPTDRK